MQLGYKDLEQMELADLESLVASGAMEGTRLEYKLRLPGNSDSEKKEFLADVSSFANASGGDIIFGISELKGLPQELVGFEVDNVDAQELRLVDMIRHGITPRLAGISIRTVRLQSPKVAIVLRIPRSFGRPHMVAFKGSSRFFSRHSSGKSQLDVGELRSAFLASHSFAERARAFRLDRVASIVASETPVKLQKPPMAVLHLIPAASFDPGEHMDISSLVGEGDLLQPLIDYGSCPPPRWNFDGLLTHDSYSQKAASSYVQFFRSGIIESVVANLNDSDDEKLLSIKWLEEQLVRRLPIYLRAQDHTGIQPPIFMMITLVGVQEYVLGVSPALRRRGGSQTKIDRNVLNIPEVMIDDPTAEPASLLRGLFDIIWNAAGWPQCLNYDKQGKWSGR